MKAVGESIKEILRAGHLKKDWEVTIPLDKLVEAEAERTRFTRLLLDPVRGAQKVRVQHPAVLVGDLDRLHRRREVAPGLGEGSLALVESRQPPRIVGGQPELGRAVVVGGPQPGGAGGQHVAVGFGLIAALLVALGDVQPLVVPAVQVAGHHAAGGLKALADGAAALLRLAQLAAELVAQPRVLRPVVPAERLVMRPALRRHFLDEPFLDLGHVFAPPVAPRAPIMLMGLAPSAG